MILRFLKSIIKIVILVSLTSSVQADEVMKLGEKVFKEKAMCGSCHVLKAAGSDGNVGPNLDSMKPTVQQVKQVVYEGINAMPAFGADKILNQQEVDAVAIYVAKSAGK